MIKAIILSVTVLLWGLEWASAQTNPPAIRPSGPPLSLFPACPCYHALGEGDGETRLDARVRLNPAQQSGAMLTFQILDANGKTMQAASVSAAQGGIVGVNLRVPVRKAATFRVAAHLLDGAGHEIAKAGTDIRVCPREEASVSLGPDGFLRVGGQPQFPIGLYSSAHYEEIGKVGFTATHNYEITTGAAEEAINPNEMRRKELLDRSWADGMRMMIELPRKAVEQAQWTQVRRCIETFRHHPGLLCWGSEERVARGTAPLTNIDTLYQLVHTLDPDHPLVLGDSRDISKNMLKDQRDFFPEEAMDVGIWWWYPIPLRSTNLVLEPPSWLTATTCQKPLWIAIQAYTTPWQHSRYPTPAEYRDMAYLSIINGVKGLWFYTGSGEHDYHHKPAGLLDQPENSHWDYVQTLIHELREASPIIMAPHSSAKITLSPPDAPVETAVRELDGKLYLLAASKSVLPQSVQFSSPALKNRHAQVLYESHAAAIEGEGLKDDFAQLGVHVYQIE